MNSDHHRYRELIRNIANDFTLGSHKHPRTLSIAFDSLMKYKSGASKQEKDRIGGLTFHTNDGKTNNGRAGQGKMKVSKAHFFM
jgi:hypothetical protein